MNSRPEISNLTLIAKENTEYAEAISTELENHIRSVSRLTSRQNTPAATSLLYSMHRCD